MAAEAGTRSGGQRGETLIEALFAILILSLVAIASYAGLRTSVRSSVSHREAAVAETVLRTAAERVQDPTFAYVRRAGCSGAATYANLPVRAGYPVVVTVRFWAPPASPTASTVAFVATCPATAAADPGLQQVELEVTTPSGATHRVTILKRDT